MKKYLIVITTLVFSLTSYAQVTELTLSLEQAINIALEKSYNIKAAKNTVSSAKETVWETTATGLPQIDATINYQNFIKQPVSLLPAAAFDNTSSVVETVEDYFGIQANRDPAAPEGFIPPCSHEEIWERLQYFLNAIIPVAEEAGVTLAAHPDDPPLPFLKQTPRLIYQPELYQKLLDLYPSKSNQLEYCLGTLSEMTEGDIYEATNQYSKQGKIGYIHFRNVMGKAPNYKEVFVDEGDVDMIRILKILKKNNFKGVLIPDHTPQINCDAPWYAGMAFAMGYMKAALKLIDKDES